MTDLDFRKQNASKLDEHVLTQDELQKLIEAKFERAQAYYSALSEREEKFAELD